MVACSCRLRRRATAGARRHLTLLPRTRPRSAAAPSLMAPSSARTRTRLSRRARLLRRAPALSRVLPVLGTLLVVRTLARPPPTSLPRAPCPLPSLVPRLPRTLLPTRLLPVLPLLPRALPVSALLATPLEFLLPARRMATVGPWLARLPLAPPLLVPVRSLPTSSVVMLLRLLPSVTSRLPPPSVRPTSRCPSLTL
jgi:hypothetical protein